MPSRNTQIRRVAQQERRSPLRFNTPGAPLSLGEETFHLATLTTAGARELQEYVNQAAIPIINMQASDTIGTILVNCAIASGRDDALLGLLERAIFERVSEDVYEGAAPSQMIYAVDSMFEQSGLEWLKRILKNSLAELGIPVGATIDRQIRLKRAEFQRKLQQIENEMNEPTGTGNDSTALPESS